MRSAYLAAADLPRGARVLEVGCGTGAHARHIAGLSGIAEVIGVDPSPLFVRKAQDLSAGTANVSFRESDGRTLPFEDGGFDVVLFHTAICHIPSPEGALREAFRGLNGGGRLIVFD